MEYAACACRHTRPSNGYTEAGGGGGGRDGRPNPIYPGPLTVSTMSSTCAKKISERAPVCLTCTTPLHLYCVVHRSYNSMVSPTPVHFRDMVHIHVAKEGAPLAVDSKPATHLVGEARCCQYTLCRRHGCAALTCVVHSAQCADAHGACTNACVRAGLHYSL
jgi:hypothetical protein